MGILSILILTLAAGVVLVIGGGVVMYMANLIKAAYEIKVQLHADVDDRLTKLDDDLDKKSRTVKRDLTQDIDKLRAALAAENSRRFEEMTEPLARRLDSLEQMLRAERGEWVKAVMVDREGIGQAQGRINALMQDIERAQGRLGMGPAPIEAAAAEPTPPDAPPPPEAAATA